MLESTFQHISGFSEKSERQLWSRGCTSWEKALDGDFSLPLDAKRRLRAGVMESRSRLDILDHGYFRETLPSRIIWRAYRPFRPHACCLDIETTGLSAEKSHVTTVCLHGADATKTYIRGKNLDELQGDLDRYRLIVSFNGARFDLPFLARSLGIRFGQLHLDLLYPLRNLGFTGGLKSVERQLGISRASEGVSGLDAVRLWRAYRSGRTVTVAGRRLAGEDALRMLVEYNRDDTVNLERLAEMTVTMMGKKAANHMHVS
jgi:uncharacterized protein